MYWGDGNCGFQAISTCLGGYEDAWDNIRRELMGELSDYHYYYSNVISNECQRIYQALNFFQKGVFAQAPYWIVMPEMRILLLQGSMSYYCFKVQCHTTCSQHGRQCDILTI